MEILTLWVLFAGVKMDMSRLRLWRKGKYIVYIFSFRILLPRDI